MPPLIDPDDWVSQKEAARMRGVSTQTISHLVRKGRFRTLEIGGHTFIHREDVANFVPDKGGRPRKSGKSTPPSNAHSRKDS